jgi:tRNA(Arg) A34 adenosine deaminase TadA
MASYNRPKTSIKAIGSCNFPATCKFSPPAEYKPTRPEEEADRIFMLLAYSIVLRYWQKDYEGPESRGYNIGSVLVDSNKNIVCWAVNSVNRTQNSTNHGEVRLMSNYLQNTRKFDLKGYTIYTTLEPCAMCAGMMTLQAVAKTIYGQRDPDYGGAIGRLELNSTKLPGGYCPYPRGVVSAESKSAIANNLDQKYCDYYTSHSDARITQWLTTADAFNIYTAASTELITLNLEFPEENMKYLVAARRFLLTLPVLYQEIPYKVNCS